MMCIDQHSYYECMCLCIMLYGLCVCVYVYNAVWSMLPYALCSTRVSVICLA